jgi:ribosomal protein S18 acetylase RimI-like enzyme
MAGRQRQLRDGGTILVRPMRADDGERLSAAFDRLSPESRRRRFFGPKERLNSVELQYFTAIDHHRHEALVAIEPAGGEIVGVARFVVVGDVPETAEAAITVIDDWQRRGVATALLEELRTRAREEGVSAFVTEVLPENERRIQELFGRVGELFERRGVQPVRLRFALSDDASGHDPAAALRAAAGGAMRVVTDAVPAGLRGAGRAARDAGRG